MKETIPVLVFLSITLAAVSAVAVAQDTKAPCATTKEKACAYTHYFKVANTGTGGTALVGETSASTSGIGLHGRNLGNGGAGVYAQDVNGLGWALAVTGTSFFNGNVGIGTDDPLQKLHVYGTALIRSSGTGVRISSHADHVAFATQNSDSTYFNMRMYIAKTELNGYVGIGVSDPGNILAIQQNSHTDPIADAWTTYSSRRWKMNIEPLPDALEKVLRLRGVSFDWKADGKHDIGLIAEEVGEVVPEVVQYEENGRDARSVDYARLTALLVEAVKTQQARIDALEREIEELRALAGRASGE
jgi:hypothetical protein